VEYKQMKIVWLKKRKEGRKGGRKEGRKEGRKN
jgi:hypothetical protein